MDSDILKTNIATNSKYAELNLEEVKKLAEYGHTDQFMANFFEISINTWNHWKIKHPEFKIVLDSWKKGADDVIERALFERAKGYEHPDTKVFYDKDRGACIVQEINRCYPPDTAAAMSWLKNRRPSEWKDKQEVEVSGDFAQLIVNARKRVPKENQEQDIEGLLE